MTLPAADALRQLITRPLVYRLAEHLALRGEPERAALEKQIKDYVARSQLDWHTLVVPIDDDAPALFGAEVMLRTLSDIVARHAYWRSREAAALLELYAAARGLTRRELEDRIIPSCGLGELIDYGPRRFTLLLGERSTPLLRESGRRMRTSRPRPRRSDDQALVERATADWNSYRRTLALESRVQSARMERAMVDGWRWTPDEFANSVLAHPLLSELARRLIWAGYDADGALLECWSLADQLSPVSDSYAPVRLERFAAIGLPHPVSVPPARRLAWVELLSDFHTAPLFPQGGRPVYELTETERAGEKIERFGGATLDPSSFFTRLSNFSWQVGQSDEWIYALRVFEGVGVTAVLVFGYDDDGGHSFISDFFFAAGLLDSSSLAEDASTLPPPLPLRGVDPVVLSEALADLSALTADPRLLVRS
ncbi:MAG TPA: DUF4132 domain-containing protein [Roseiflexaceae bacterium]|nr:DUF4132 domain-containing protein [Roseiflexaceae bacterium]